jgi:hypothetical protein
MRMQNRKPSTSTTFVDASSGEDILQMASTEDGLLLLAYRLYDAAGNLVVDSDGLSSYPEGLVITDPAGEVLLEVPNDSSGNVKYCLYNSNGALLTRSDGVRTRIFPLLRMESVSRWTPPEPDPAHTQTGPNGH